MATSNISTGDRLAFTFFAALALHLFVMLQLGFKLPGADKVAPTLNITLATHASQDAPEKANFLAQANQEASGSGETVQELLTTEQAEFNDTVIREINPPPQQKTKQSTQPETETLNTSNDSRFQFRDDEQTDQTAESETVKAQDEDILLSNPEAAALQAKLDRIRQAQALQPKIKRIQTEATRASTDAAYLHQWNTRVETVGNQHFPQEAINKEIFGTLMMVVAIEADGSIANVEIIQPSEHTLLNQSALEMVHRAAPFDKIPPDVLDGYDQIEITRIWSFEITGLSTTSAQ